jgi:hypothetical protein
LQTDLDVRQLVMIRAIASINAGQSTLLWLCAIHLIDFIELLFQSEEVVDRNDGIADSSVHDGVATLDICESVVVFRVLKCHLCHVESPVLLPFHNVSPEDIGLSSPCLGILIEVVAAKCDKGAILARGGCQVEAEHRIQLICLGESVDMLNLFDKGLELFLLAFWSKSNDSGKPVLSDAFGLVTLEDLDALDTWLAIIFGEANFLLV